MKSDGVDILKMTLIKLIGVEGARLLWETLYSPKSGSSLTSPAESEHLERKSTDAILNDSNKVGN